MLPWMSGDCILTHADDYILTHADDYNLMYVE